MAWHINGDYFENCNCDLICPCPSYALQGPADNERCFLPLFVHIEDGENDGVRLDGLNFVIVIDAPQVMAEGDWRNPAGVCRREPVLIGGRWVE